MRSRQRKSVSQADWASEDKDVIIYNKEMQTAAFAYCGSCSTTVPSASDKASISNVKRYCEAIMVFYKSTAITAHHACIELTYFYQR